MKEHLITLSGVFNTIPEFIDPKSGDDFELWKLLRDINFLISKLINDKVLSNYKIDKLVEEYFFIDFIIRNELECETQKYFITQLFIVGIIEVCEVYCLREELYESCENLKKFKDKI